MFSGASNLADGVDKALAFIFITAFIFIVGITIFMVWMLFKYNRKKKREAMQFTGSVSLEIIWTAIPLVLVLVMFYYGWAGFAPMREVPDDAMEITAIGRMWEWEFDYGDGKRSSELVIPLNRAVKLNLLSEDVNHSLFIPAFRVKEDVVPGYDNFLWFIPNTLGEYEILCTEYCGLLHSGMVSKAIVVEDNEFIEWLAGVEDIRLRPEHPGLVVMRNNACLACHSLDGTKLVGPSFKGLWASKKSLITNDGEVEITVDAEYIRESIYNPDGQIVKGYSRGLMQSYRGMVSDEEMLQIIEYFEQQNGN